MSYIPASGTFNDLIIKKLQGKPFTTTAQSGALEAPGSTFNKVFNNNIYAEDIPISYYDAETLSSVNTVNDSNGRYLYDVYDTDQTFIKYYKRVRLGSSTVVPGQAFKFIGNDEDSSNYSNILLNGIASYGNYTITIEESSNGVDFSPISSSHSTKAWWYDPASGYVTFFVKQDYVASNDNASSFKPYITFWRYEGDMGIKLNNIDGDLAVTGNVGIGITNPLGNLHVFNTAESKIIIDRDPGNDGTNYVPVGTSVGGIHFRSADYSWTSQKTGASIEAFPGSIGYSGSCHDIRFRTKANQAHTNLTDRMTIKYDGRVGIGTTNPTYKLQVDGNFYFSGSDCQLKMNNSGNTTHFSYGGNGDHYLRSNSGDGKVILQDTGGNVGIGTSTANYKLQISGGSDWAATAWSPHIRNSGGQSWMHWADQNASSYDTTSIYCSGAIVGSSLAAHSDKRIKKDIVEISDDYSLQILRKLKPCLYKYKDPISRNEFNSVEGFIAQEVKEIIPSAVKLHIKNIPNIMDFGSFIINSQNEKIITFDYYDTSKLELDASNNLFTKLILRDTSGIEITVEILEIISTTELKISSTQEISPDIFIYGQNVNDFHTLQKDRIFTTGISALQEVDRQLQAEKVKTSVLEAKTAALENQLADVLNRISILENNQT